MPTYKCSYCGKTTCQIIIEEGYIIDPEYKDECLQDYNAIGANFELVI